VFTVPDRFSIFYLVLKYPGPASLMYLRTLIFTSPKLAYFPAGKRITYFISIDSSIHRKTYHITDNSSSLLFFLVCFSCQPTERSAANFLHVSSCEKSARGTTSADDHSTVKGEMSERQSIAWRRTSMQRSWLLA